MKMIRYLTGLTVFMMITLAVMAQTPTGFKYQTVIRNADGQALAEKTIQLRITLQNEEKSKKFYQESHSVTTNDFGLVNLVIGEGDDADGVFANIPWSQEPIFLQVEAREGTTGSYTNQGTQPMMAVPYALHATNIRTVDGSKNPNPSGKEDEPLFLVRNKQGEVVFAVYNNGVEVYIEEGEGKSRKAGFAIGGLSRSKGIELEPENDPAFFKISPYSAEIRMLENEDGKSRKAGFAIGGLSRSKDQEEIEFMQVNPYNTRININDEDAKSRKAGFAIGGLSRSKSVPNLYMQVTDTSTNVTNVFAAKEHVVTSGRVVEHMGEKIYDASGNEYKVVKIGSQVWMAENLRATDYWEEGNIKELVMDGGPIDVSYYQDNPEAMYYVPYNTLPLENHEDGINLCPIGYRIPNNVEWETLISYVESKILPTCQGCNPTYEVVRALSAVFSHDADSDWNKGKPSDKYGFNALPSGFYHLDSIGNITKKYSFEPDQQESKYASAFFMMGSEYLIPNNGYGYDYAYRIVLAEDEEVASMGLFRIDEIPIPNDAYGGNIFFNIRCMRDAD